MLIIDNIEKSFNNHQVLKGITLQLEEGNIYGLIGANGTGKTTLFNCLAGLYRHKGIVKHDTWHPLKDNTGLLETHPYFFPKMTGEEYLHFCCHARKLSPESNNFNIFNLPLKKYVDYYSTGMKKKLAINGILLQNNRFLLLDEPYNGVDLMSCLEIKRQLLTIRQNKNIIVLSSHMLSSMTELCDEIFFLKDGIIAKTFAKDEYDIIEKELLSTNNSL